MEEFNERTKKEYEEFAEAFREQYAKYKDPDERPPDYDDIFGRRENKNEKDVARALNIISGGPREKIRRARSKAAASQPNIIVPMQRELVKLRKEARHDVLKQGTLNAYIRMNEERETRRDLSYRPPARKVIIPKRDFGGVGIDTNDVPAVVGTAGMPTNQPLVETAFKDHSLITGRGMLGSNGEVTKSSPNFF